MTDIVLNNITSGYNIAKMNVNFQKIEDSINNDVLNLAGGNNTMLQDLDMNGNNLLNVESLSVQSLRLNNRPVTTSEFVLGTNVVDSDAIQDGAITQDKLASLSVTQDKLALFGRTDVATANNLTLVDLANAEVIIPTRDYGFDNTGTTANDAKLAIMLADIQKSVDGRGRKIRLVAGHYKFNNTWAFTAYAVGLVHNIILEGEGPANTILDFSGAPTDTDGITFNAGAHFTIKDLEIVAAKRDGLVIGAGNVLGSTNYCSHFIIENVRIQGAVRDGLVLTNAYLGSIRDIWSKSSGRNGVNIQGFSTALKVDRCESSSSGSSNWVINGVIYSTFSSCGSDDAGQFGYALSNLQGVVFSGCGAESNQKDSWYIYTSDASTSGIPSAAQDIHGVVFLGCYSLSGSLAGAGSYATFINANTQDNRPIEFKIIGGSAYGATVSDRALILNGASGQVVCHKDMFFDAGCVAADYNVGTTEVVNSTVVGRSCIVKLSTPQSTSTGSLVKIGFDTVYSNSLGATLSANAIVIPRGVSKIRVTAGISWAASATGTRYIELDKNGTSGTGFPSGKQQGVNEIQSQQVSSLPIDVVEGDSISLQGLQTSGGALVAYSGNNTFICVEALG